LIPEIKNSQCIGRSRNGKGVRVRVGGEGEKTSKLLNQGVQGERDRKQKMGSVTSCLGNEQNAHAGDGSSQSRKKGGGRTKGGVNEKSVKKIRNWFGETGGWQISVKKMETGAQEKPSLRDRTGVRVGEASRKKGRESGGWLTVSKTSWQKQSPNKQLKKNK